MEIEFAFHFAKGLLRSRTVYARCAANLAEKLIRLSMDLASDVLRCGLDANLLNDRYQQKIPVLTEGASIAAKRYMWPPWLMAWQVAGQLTTN